MAARGTAGPRQAVPTKKGRYYIDPDESGRRYISVTNVLDTAIGKPALVAWAARTVAEQAVAQLPTVTKLSRTDPAAAIALLKGTPFEARDTAAARGTAVHDLAERHALEQDLGEVDPELLTYLTQYLAWRDDFNPTFYATEITVANRTLGYAGTLDAIVDVELDGVRVRPLVDYKTGKGVYDEVALQLAAYRHAEVMWLPDGTSVPMPATDCAYVLHLRPDGYAFLPVRAERAEFEAFCAALQVATWLHGTKDNPAVGDALIPTTPETTEPATAESASV